MDEAQVVGIMIFVTNQNPPVVLQPRKQPLDFPAPLVAPQLPPILRPRFLAIALVRPNHLDRERLKLCIQRVRVVRLIPDQSLRLLVNKAFDESPSDKGDFMRRSRLRVDGDRKTRAVCHCHELRTLAPLGLSDFAAPFLATMNVPSMKHSLKSSSPLERRSLAKVSKRRSSRPSLTHCWNLRWQVWYGGKRSGKSHQRAPERSIHSTPFKTSRSGRRGLPRVCTAGGLSNSGSINAHCWSVNSSRRAIVQI
jgi:hypothetical protein